jgi:SAM-dependent methyltransferase
MLRCFRRFARLRVRRVLDIACGTGPHALRLAARGFRVTALDVSAERLAYVGGEAARRGLAVTTRRQDMARFRLPQRVDAAICLQNSQGYLLTSQDIVGHLRAVARALRPGGLYIFDRYVVSSWTDPARRWTWARQRSGVSVRAAFSTLHAPDPVSQTFTERLVLETAEAGRAAVYRESHRSRLVHPQELRALVALAGRLALVGWFSAFSLAVPFDRARRAMMVVAVLRRV